MRPSWLILALVIGLAAVACGADSARQGLAPPAQIQAAGKAISVDIGHAAPLWADIDQDGKPELLVGQFGDGKLRIYPNFGTAKDPEFIKFTWFQAGGADGKVPSG
jgi:hypothetical protein